MSKEPTTEQLLAHAQGVVEQWEKHDVHRVTEADKAFLWHGKPAEVWMAIKFIEAVETINRYEAEEYDRQMDTCGD